MLSISGTEGELGWPDSQTDVAPVALVASVSDRGDSIAVAEGLVLAATANSSEAFPRFASAAELDDFLVSEAVKRYHHLFGQPINRWWPTWDYYVNGQDAVVTSFGVPADAGAPNHSDTNTQVAGVDEGDIVETDGSWLYVLSGQELVILSSWPAEAMRVASRMKFDGRPIAEYLHGDRLTVLSDASSPRLLEPTELPALGTWQPQWWLPKLEVTVIDVADREAPRVVQTTELDGMLVDSRAVGSNVYLVTRGGFLLPGPEILTVEDDGATPPPDPGVGGQTPDVTYSIAAMPIWWPPGDAAQVYETEAQYLARVRGHAADLALPHYISYADDGTVLAAGLVNEATEIHQPRGPNDTNLMSIVVFDMASDAPGPAASVGVPTQDVSHMYASTQSIYLFGGLWDTSGAKTEVLRFALNAPAGQSAAPNEVQLHLAAAGIVPGCMLNQFSADEYHGDLRIATTVGWGQSASSGVYVLRQQGRDLVTIGAVAGLALGEQMYSARFLGELAFLVTFLRTDPLWTIDLADPANPRAVGELEVPGFSHYLQPVDGGYLIGLGRQVDAQTGAWQAPQISLFDVADIENPRLVDRFDIDVGPWGESEAFSDHHAVGYYPESGVLTLSVASGGFVVQIDGERYLPPGTDLWVFQIHASAGSRADERTGAIELLGRIEHDAPIRRSVRIDQCLYSISSDTVSVHKLLDPSPGGEIVRLYYGERLTPLDLGDVLEVGGAGFDPADPWYSFVAGHDEPLTLEVSSAAGPRQVNLTLYDEQLRVLIVSKAFGGKQRIDWRTVAGEKYFVRVSEFPGASPDASFTLRLDYRPDLHLYDGRKEIAAGGTVEFGVVRPRAPVTKTLTVKNQGQSDITLSPLAARDLPAGFTIVRNLGRTRLAPGRSTTFTLRMTSAAQGDFGGSILLHGDNGSVEGTFALQLKGMVRARTRTSANGWELYAWRQDGEVRFSLLQGTARRKSDDEIVQAAVRGPDALKPLLYTLRGGQSITLVGRRLAQKPPKDPQVDAVADYARRIGLGIEHRPA